MALLGGIVAMHALTIAPLDTIPRHSTTTTVAHHATGGHTDSADQPCQGDDCRQQQHAGLHACVFIMTATLVCGGPGAVVLGRHDPCDTDRPAAAAAVCRRRQRAPPWTVLSLSELSILRI